jgi:transposase
MIEIYKSRDLVEQAIKSLKSNIEINPNYHKTDKGRETHAVCVVYGYFLLSLLHALLKEN